MQGVPSSIRSAAPEGPPLEPTGEAACSPDDPRRDPSLALSTIGHDQPTALTATEGASPTPGGRGANLKLARDHAPASPQGRNTAAPTSGPLVRTQGRQRWRTRARRYGDPVPRSLRRADVTILCGPRGRKCLRADPDGGGPAWRDQAFPLDELALGADGRLTKG